MQEEECNTTLALGIGGGCRSICRTDDDRNAPPVQLWLFSQLAKEEVGKQMNQRSMQRSGSRKTKKGDDNNEGGTKKKKLRLTGEQTALLEEDFREHNTLNPARKQELAKRLSLTLRQIEIWFQNRRARTKTKQTEANYEFLKKCCEILRGENQRLKRELQEVMLLRAKSTPCVKPSMSLCPSCSEQVVTARESSSRSGGDSVMALDDPRIYDSGNRGSSLTC